MNDDKPMIHPGSMLNTSEGLMSLGAISALTSALTSSSDWRVQAASALGIAIIAAAYILGRSRVKEAEPVE